MSVDKRLDLQGIRGIAIISVLLFHFFPKSFPNGYIGVDQFFVLSGYLISMILSRTDNVNFKDFYYRRVKRIVPLYLVVVLFILCALFSVFPVSNLEINMESAWNALFFLSNFAGNSEEKRYAAMLSTAEDCFTHTWSLSVEMQFYLVVPLIFLRPKRCRTQFVALIGITSLVLSLLVDPETAFNSVMARLWQFLVGFAAFLMTTQTNSKTPEEDNCKLLEEQQDQDHEPYVKDCTISTKLLILAYILLFFCVSLSFWINIIPPMVLRPSVTLLTGLLILLGSRVSISFLCNPFIVYIGDISYALYLVHWPIYAYIKLNLEPCRTYLLVGLLISIVLAAFLTETFERSYLKLDQKSIFTLLIVLYTLNFGILTLSSYDLFNSNEEVSFNISSIHISSSENSTIAEWHIYDNISRAEAIRLNDKWTKVELGSLFTNNCTMRGPVKKDKDTMLGCDFASPSNETSLLPKLMIIGNSYASNVAPTIVDACNNRTSQISIFWASACETLVDSMTRSDYKCGGTVDRYVSIVHKERPDWVVMAP